MLPREQFTIGRDLWREYVRVNGYAVQPGREGLSKLSRLLDLNAAYIQKHINFYLER